MGSVNFPSYTHIAGSALVLLVDAPQHRFCRKFATASALNGPADVVVMGDVEDEDEDTTCCIRPSPSRSTERKFVYLLALAMVVR